MTDPSPEMTRVGVQVAAVEVTQIAKLGPSTSLTFARGGGARLQGVGRVSRGRGRLATVYLQVVEVAALDALAERVAASRSQLARAGLSLLGDVDAAEGCRLVVNLAPDRRVRPSEVAPAI